MKENKQNFQYIVPFYSKMQNKIFIKFTLNISKVVYKFHALDFSLNDDPQVGWLVEIDDIQMKTLSENNQLYATWEIANILEISKSSNENNLYQLGYVNHFDTLLPYKKNKKNCISLSNLLFKHNENVLFLKQVVLGNEK